MPRRLPDFNPSAPGFKAEGFGKWQLNRIAAVIDYV